MVPCAVSQGLDLVRTHVAPNWAHHPLTGDHYPAINKPVALLHWLKARCHLTYLMRVDQRLA